VKHTLRIITIIAGLLIATASWAALKDFAGKAHLLTEYTGKGKWTIVMLWAADCRVCNAEVGQYVQFDQDHKDKDASIIGVSLDGEAGIQAARDFVKRHAIPFTNLIGEPQEVADLYASLTGSDWVGTPSFLVYDPKGELLAAQVGAVPTDLIKAFIQDHTRSADQPKQAEKP